MALIFCDSFDHYAIGDILKKWSTGGSYVNFQPGRFGTGNSLRFGNADWTVTKVVPNLTTCIIGFAILVESQPSNEYIISLKDDVTDQVRLRFTGSLRLEFYRSGTYLGVSTTPIEFNTWTWLEIKVTISDSAGVVGVRLNGVDDPITFATGTPTTQDTQATTNSRVTSIKFAGAGGGTYRIDDLYICDASGTANNDFLGDIRIQYLNPTANGTTNQFTPSAGANYETVDETTTPSDADYNVASTSGYIDLFTMADLSASGTVFGVQSVLRHLKTDAGTRTIAPKYRIGSTNYSGEAVYVGTSAAYALDQMDTSPATASGWTDTEINAMEFGYEVAS